MLQELEKNKDMLDQSTLLELIRSLIHQNSILTEQNKMLAAKVEELTAELQRVNELYKNAQKALYGRSSEKGRFTLYDAMEQLTLFNEAEVCTEANEPEPRLETLIQAHTRKPKRTKEELAQGLPVEEVILQRSEEELKCNICESDLKLIGKVLVREELVILLAQYLLSKVYTETYACVACEKETDEATIVRAEVPTAVIPHGLASPENAAFVMYQKYVNALPLYPVSPLQGSALGKAVTYADNQRPYLNAFLLDGHISLSNNRAENMIRPFTIGRKNWLFADTPNGAEASALAYSIIETVKANGLNVLKYLIFLFTHLPSIIVKNQMDRISDFFPWSDTLLGSCQMK